MPIDRVHLIGAGGHGAVVLDALLAMTPGVEVTVRDARAGLQSLGREVITPEIGDEMAGVLFHVAIGSAAIRSRLHARALAMGARPLAIVHPAASVSPYAVVEPGAFIAAGAVVAAQARVGEGAIVNHGAVIDHDAVVGAFAHVAPNAALGGGVAVGDGVLIGSGAVVLPGVSIAGGCVIGAGAVVLAAIGARGTWAGNPARRIGAK